MMFAGKAERAQHQFLRDLAVAVAHSGEGQHKGHHHFIPRGLVAEVEGDKVWLSANGAVAVTFEEEE